MCKISVAKIFINVENERQEASAKILLTMLNYLIQKSTNRKHVLFVIDKLDSNRNLISLPYWMKEGEQYDVSYIVACDDLASFSNNPRAERFFRNFKKAATACVLVHQNEEYFCFQREFGGVLEIIDENLEPVATYKPSYKRAAFIPDRS